MAKKKVTTNGPVYAETTRCPECRARVVLARHPQGDVCPACASLVTPREEAPREDDNKLTVLVPVTHGAGVVRITATTQAGPVVASYLLRVLGTRLVRLEKFRQDGGQAYTVTLGDHPACDCDAARKGGQRCKHIRALLAMVASGQL